MADVRKDDNDHNDNEGERLAETRVAPTRRRNYLIVDYEKQDERDPPSYSRTNDDENTEEMLRSVTGKRFSLTEFFKKKKKETPEAKTKEQVDKSKTETEDK